LSYGLEHPEDVHDDRTGSFVETRRGGTKIRPPTPIIDYFSILDRYDPDPLVPLVSTVAFSGPTIVIAVTAATTAIPMLNGFIAYSSFFSDPIRGCCILDSMERPLQRAKKQRRRGGTSPGAVVLRAMVSTGSEL
jgi:hypothetical protein